MMAVTDWLARMVLLICLTHHSSRNSAVLAQTSCQNRACQLPIVDFIQDLPNRTVTVSSTCGDPANNFELHLRGPTGATYQQQICNASDPANAHPSSFLYDVTRFILLQPKLDTWWQSANGARDVHMTLTLDHSFLFETTLLAFRGLRPQRLYFQKSTDFGNTWNSLQYYAVSCSQSFPGIATTPGTPSYFPICEEKYVFGDATTERPTDIQEVRYSPSQELGPSFSQETVVRYFTLTNLRIILGVPGSEVNLRDYFAVAYWKVEGQCVCYGHASQCQLNQGAAECVCQHNTAGRNCDRCLPLFNNKPWRAAVVGEGSSNACEDCGCNGFSSSCIYDQAKGYGVCQGCAENTGGDKCERCNENFFRNPFTDPANNDTCVACLCNANGTQANTICNETDGSCTCKLNVQNNLCDECKDTFFNLNSLNPVGCQPCDCDPVGSMGSTNFCNKQTGQCICKTNVEGNRCDTCKMGTYNLNETDPNGCSPCSCELGASLSGQCNVVTGDCTCRPNITGRACNETLPGFYVPKLDGMTFEAELASANNDVTVEERPTNTDTAKLTGRGFLKVPASTVVTFADVKVPRNQNYEIVLRYESTSAFQNVRIELTQHVPAAYECQGVNQTGNPIALVANVPAAGVGGSMRFGPACLNSANQYNVSVSIGLGDGGASAALLLDSLVLLPVLNDVEVFRSAAAGPNQTQAAMTACWEAAIQARPGLVGQMGECSHYEFSIMAEVYSGAVACSCNAAGTTPATECDSYSGQCQCANGVTSQSCDYCAAYYYGYNTAAGCRACGCNNNGAVMQSCNKSSGVCTCRTNVIGDKCNACLPQHYSLSSGSGCVPCTCAGNYSLDGACDDLGQCNCKPGIGGQSCTECAPGYYQLTTDGCTFCGCSPVGIAQSGCDSQGNCLCQPATMGLKCDQCAEGYYGFGPWSERGCSQCYCSSHSRQCTTATSWYEAQVVSRWSLLNTGAVAPRWTGLTSTESVPLGELPILSVTDPRLILYLTRQSNSTDVFFASPNIYHSDFRTAYGQNLTFALSQSTDQSPSVNPEGDVFIYGAYVTEALVAALPRLPNTSATQYQFMLHENYWRKGSPQGDQPTAEYVMRTLAGIQSIRIRAKYNTLPGTTVYLHEASLEFAAQKATAQEAVVVSTIPAGFVENCTCPIEYTGLFCETCAPGYKRANSSLGSFSDCVPCDCNGHSDLPCDPVTGFCQGCLYNTTGNFCEMCQNGYFGNAMVGTQGDCQPCMCPGPPGSVNSFADVCNGQGVCTGCAAGHSGDNCQTCISGYYGVPTDIMSNNGQCLPCSCSLSPAECDTITGQCLNCTGNTGSRACDVCDFGYWGSIENCQKCVCNSTGGYGNCSLATGICYCYPNVIGDQCTQCAVNTWGYASGAGCTDCDCHAVGTANQQTQCDLVTGQCDCKPRVTGQKCDECAQGFWNIDQECIPCNCNLEGTDPGTCDSTGNCTCGLSTGQCGCKSATIAGRTCDKCGRVEEDGTSIVSEVFVGSFPNCEPCPECYQNWRQAFQNMADTFTSQGNVLTGLLANYGNLTSAEVDSILEFVRQNLSSAAVVIQAGSQEVVNLEDIEAGFRQITSEVANFTALVNAIETRRLALGGQITSISRFTGDTVVQDGVVRNADQLQATLNALNNTQNVLFQMANGSWVDIQGMYSAIEASEQRVQQLSRDVNALLQNIETAATERQRATEIINDSFRNAEFIQNAERFAEIDRVQQAYPLVTTSLNATAASQLAQQANQTAQDVLGRLALVRERAVAQAHQAEVARFNATNAERAATAAQSAAMTYKDLALSTKANMTSLYVQAINSFFALQEGQVRSTETRNIAHSVRSLVVRPSAQMQQFVNQINAAALTEATVQTLLQDATSKFGRAEQVKTSAREAQQEAASVSAQLQTVEYELTEAARVRTDTTQRLVEADANITSISSTTSQVQQQANQATTSAQQTSASVLTILQGVRDTDQCFRARRNQALDAANRARLAETQASTAQQTHVSSTQDASSLSTTIDTAKQQSSSALRDVQAAVDDAQRLQRDLLAAQQIADLDALVSQYQTQRNQMQVLSATLDRLEASLNLVLTNLDGAGGGTLQCN